MSQIHSKIKFFFKKSIIEEDFIQIRIPEGADEIECSNNEIKRILIDEDYYTETNYPITIKPNFSNLGSIIEINPEGNTVIGFVIDDSIGSLLGFDETILYKEYNLSPNPVDILSSDNIFLECDVAQGVIYRGKKIYNISQLDYDRRPRLQIRRIIRRRYYLVYDGKQRYYFKY